LTNKTGIEFTPSGNYAFGYLLLKDSIVVVGIALDYFSKSSKF
jgi:hypothetical protein